MYILYYIVKNKISYIKNSNKLKSLSLIYYYFLWKKEKKT